MKQPTNETQRPRGHSVRDYWTRGTISSLCGALSELGGVRIELRDEQGLVLDANSYHEDDGFARPVPLGAGVVPIEVGEETIGSVVVYPRPSPELPDEGADLPHGLIERIGELIAATASEMCTDVAQLRYRVDEVAVLYRLSSLLVRGGSVEDTLRLSLELAIDVLGLDAGAIMLLPEDSEALPRADMETELERSASVGLSEEWLGNPVPLSIEREFDRLSLAGKVVTSEDLSDDPRVLVPDQCRDESLIAFLGTGMVFDRQPIGVIRLYQRHRRKFSSAERKLIKSIGESAAAAVEQARLLKMQARQRRVQRALR
ncbi:MAG TPA: GAF domain-containing protein, partial [Myxococcota bacterium]|nr:GAF domain-containing protein [Myxococcota bacterium]